jgi:hypothetical protein
MSVKDEKSQEWRYIPIIPSTGRWRQRQGDHKFEASSGKVRKTLS